MDRILERGLSGDRPSCVRETLRVDSGLGTAMQPASSAFSVGLFSLTASKIRSYYIQTRGGARPSLVVIGDNWRRGVALDALALTRRNTFTTRGSPSYNS